VDEDLDDLDDLGEQVQVDEPWGVRLLLASVAIGFAAAGFIAVCVALMVIGIEGAR
jgi:hypothetical protein